MQSRYLWIQQKVADKEAAIDRVKGTENPADAGTKYLSGPALGKCLEWIGAVRMASKEEKSASDVRRKQAADYESTLADHTETLAAIDAAIAVRRRRSREEDATP